MQKKQIQHITVSGYLRINNDLEVSEAGGDSFLFFKLPKDKKNSDLKDCISGFDKESQEYLLDCLNRAQKSREVVNCSLFHEGTNFFVTLTPLPGDELILSFSQQSDKSYILKDHQYWHSIHSNTITLTFDRNHELVFSSGPVINLMKADTKKTNRQDTDRLDYSDELKTEIIELLKKVFNKEEFENQPVDIKIPAINLFLRIFVYPALDENGDVSHVHLCIPEYGVSEKYDIQPVSEEEQANLAIGATQLGMWDWNIQNNTVIFSKKWKGQLGYYPDELPDQYSTFEKLLHQGDKDRLTREIQNFFKSDSLLFESEFRLRHKNGNYLWMSCQANCIRDTQNMAVRLIGVNRDITSEKRASVELSLFKQAVMQSPVSVIITDTEGYIEFFNTAFYKKSGWDPEEIIGKKPNILRSGFHSDDFYVKLWKTITSGNIWQGELKNKRKNGRLYTEIATISPLRNERGAITHFIKISEDISALRKLEHELRKARHSVEVANIYKKSFLASMSHKIRTPVNGIIGFSDLLKSGVSNEEQQNRYIRLIQQNSAVLLHLIDSIIDAARIEADEMKIKKESCSLKDMFIELKPEMEKLSENKRKENIEVSFVFPRESHHDVIFTDPVRLKQILFILFENALKQTEKGFIEIGYHIFSERKLQFYIHDSGAGMDNSQLEMLNIQFGPNDRSAATRYKSGIGLGLTICRGLVRLLGGQMGVKSEKGQGTLFYFTIPYDKIKVQNPKLIIEQSKNSRYDFSKYTILIAEDVNYNFEYLKNIFASTGALLLWAKDGIDVLNFFNNQAIDLILMDIQLPEISGIEATRQIRKKNKTIPIIAQTGYTMDEDREKCLSAGCNEVLIKPLRIEDVLNAVSRYLK